jgi:hypothetical protein
VPLGPEGGADDSSLLLRALEAHGLELVDAVTLQPTLEPTLPTGQRREEASPIPETQSATLEVNVEPDEHAVVLLEQDGMYSWSLPESVSLAEVPGTTVRRRITAPVQAKRIAFHVEIRASQLTGPATRMGLFGQIVFDRVKVFILKYTAELIVQEGVEYLERDSQEKLLIVDSADPAAWHSAGTSMFAADHPARVLLLVHGTFSSTIGSFGGLAATPWGEEFMQAVKSNYDAVLGFDHFTLKRSPEENAFALIKELERIAWPEGSQIDVVAFSRGGLVVRSLMNQLSSKLKKVLRFRRAVFVACTNEGTRLADPDNLRTFIDLYTNLATAACRLIGMLPQAKPVTVVLKELIQGMASLVKYIAATAISEGAVPGLAAMQPGSAFLAALDRPRSAKSWLADVSTYIITSEFVPRLSGADAEPKELPARFLTLIANGFVTQLMKEGNDLVVNTSSMAVIQPQAGQMVQDRFEFGKTSKVYHTIYFLRPEVVNALSQWLKLVKPEPVSVAKPTRRGRRTSPIGAEPVTPSALAPAAEWPMTQQAPVNVDTRFIVAPAHSPMAEVAATIGETPTPYVVVKRFHNGETLHYSFPSEDVLTAAAHAKPGTSLEEAMHLPENDASEERSASDTSPVGERPAVVVSDDHVVGVIPQPADSSSDIVALANAVLARASPADEIAAARAMPKFEATQRTTPITTLHLRADMDDSVVVGRATSIDVTLSREIIGGYIGPAAAEGAGKVQVARKVAVQAIARSQFKVIENDRFEIDVPAPGRPWNGSFDVKATTVGDGEIWIVMSQNQVTLSTVTLNPKVVENVGRRERIMRSGNGAEQAGTSPIDQLLIVDQRNGDELSLFFQFQSPTLGIIDKYYSPPFKVEPREYVKNLYQRIEEQWSGSSEDAKTFTEDLRALGASLFTELFPPGLQSKLWELRDKLTKIQVISTEPFIPWEIVHLKEPNKPLGPDIRFFAQLGVVRWLHQAGWPPSIIRVRKGRVRHVIPKYPDPRYTLKDVEEERQFMTADFGSMEITPRPGPVRTALQDGKGFDLIHFACHGSADSENITDARIMLEGRIEGQVYVPEYLNAVTVEYNTNLRNPDGNRPLVFVNACQVGRAGYKLTGLGGFAQAFLSAGAGIFAGTLWSVGDEPASTFAKQLYTRMMAGDELSNAAIKAREEARKSGDASWLCYVVYGHPSAKLATN